MDKSRRLRRTRLKIGVVAFFALLALTFSTLAAAGHSQSFGSTPMPRAPHNAALGARDGVIPDGETLSPFDVDQAAIANLEPELREAIQDAAVDAKSDGIEVVITSGWRSKAYQQQLLDEAVVTYGSLVEARKWVNTPEKSTHVSGEAVDVGFTDADYWLIQYGYEYGLCQTYANEIWHFELTVEPGTSCPAPITDASTS
ncbi:MAG: M15 family metallopeptidase [Thermomicrobiales bacterium]